MTDERFSTLLFRTCSVGCVLGMVANLYFLLGIAGYVRTPSLNFGIVLVLAASALFLLSHFSSIPLKTNWLGRIIWVAVLLILLAEIVLGFWPPTARDALAHHLAILQLYAQSG